ncbi:ras-related protein Rap-2c-like [Haliotis rubra]|uniref:ras-related protein Rap-2c-like n=1 Tax=Haliotis rubra TaxID=36100 RepID=UPI001EE4F873|nr:ras-related protein Rap-2c-like [Haliotis rubra]XP_046583495.1 ras-related protein Rap-2c-like [Haliotis rubra]
MASASAESPNKDQSNNMTFNLIVMGATSVGKTSLINQFVQGKNKSPSTENTKDFYSCKITDGDLNVCVDILDTHGDLEFPQMMKLAIQTGDAFVLVYAVDDKTSFQRVCCIRDMVLKWKSKEKKNTIIVVVCNKMDLDVPNRSPPKEVAETVVERDWGQSHMEITTRDKDAVDKVFKEVIQRHIWACGGSAASGQRKMTSPVEMIHKLRRRLTLRRLKPSS